MGTLLSGIVTLIWVSSICLFAALFFAVLDAFVNYDDGEE